MKIISIIICLSISILSFSQDKVKLLNKGNEYFVEEDFLRAEKYYKKSLEADNQYYKANLNIGHALFRQAFDLIKNQDSTGITKCSESELFYKNSINLTKNKDEKAESLYNLGNSQLLSQKLKESIESYKKSLRLFPDNMNAKHNLALAQYLLNKKQKKQENNQNQEDQEEQKKQDQKEQDQKEQDQKEQDQKEQDQKNKNQNNQQKESNQELTKEEIEQILNALEREEKDVQEDLQEKKVIGGDKLLKDW